MDNTATNPAAHNNILERRQFLKLSALAGATLTAGCASKTLQPPLENIQPIEVLLRWGDALFPNLPPFDPNTLTADNQMQRFGYNCDFTAYFPIDNNKGLLCVNHEFVDRKLMHPNNKDPRIAAMVEMASVGVSIVEISRTNNQWQANLNSSYNRRLSCHNSNYVFSGPAAGSKRLGERATGMLGNCAGGTTPWGTLLTCEENFDYFFQGQHKDEQRNNKRYGVGRKDANDWGDYDDRFDLEKSPLEPNRYGWVVEVNPFKPNSTPIKHTALGRFKHEAACCVETSTGHVVVYSGDDQHFEYFYRYISSKPWRSTTTPLADGVLSVAKFLANGSIQWLPLVYGERGLTLANGFNSQADVLIETRHAATIVGGTPMDRPEGITLNPKNGHVYFCCTKNKKRTKGNAANPRTNNRFGHIITINSKDHGAQTGTWEFLTMGDDRRINPGALPCPDNIMAAPNGDLYIATDGAESAINIPEGLYKMNRDRTATRLYASPKGAEVTGPSFTPDSKTCFFSVQHPAQGSSFENPDNRWPDNNPNMPPRPSVVVMKV